MKVKVNGILINYEVDGSADGPWMIFSNSLATNLSMWDHQASHFSRKFRVLRYDQRGHGGTDASTGRYTFELLISDVIGLMDALAIERAYFCGLSMGGATAMALAQQHGHRLDRVIVCDSRCASTPSSTLEWETRIKLAQTNGMSAVVDDTLSRWFPPSSIGTGSPHFDRVRRMIETTSVDGFVGCAAALADHDFLTNINLVSCPVLFLAGSEDGSAPTAMKQMQTKLRNSRFEVLPRAGHISNLDRPELFNQLAEDFLLN